MTKISIIVPIYNKKDFLDKCLKSLQQQTLVDIEIILVNDGSTDGSEKIAEKYANADKRFKFISQNNQGVSVARNVGIKASNGEFLGFVDADDFIEKTFFETLYSQAKKNDCDIAMSTLININGKKHKKLISHNKDSIAKTIDEKIKLSVMKSFNFVFNKIYKKENIINNKVFFPEGISYCEDIYFTLRALYFSDKMIYVKNCVYYNVHNEGSKVNNLTQKDYDEHKKMIEDSIEFANAKNIKLPENLSVRKIKKYYLFNLIQLIKVKEWECEKKYYFLGLIPFLKCKIQQRSK